MDALQVVRLEASPLCNTRQHPGPDLLVVMKGEHYIWRTSATQGAVRAALTFKLPPSTKQSGEHASCFCRRPFSHPGSGGERDAEKFGGRLAMLELLREHSERERLYFGDSLGP